MSKIYGKQNVKEIIKNKKMCKTESWNKNKEEKGNKIMGWYGKLMV